MAKEDVEAGVPSSDSTASWAQKEYEAWQRAVEERKATEAVYNEWLTEVDRLHDVPPLEEAVPVIRQLQGDLNRLYELLSVFREVPVRRWNPRWWLNRLLEWALGPLLKRQRAFNAVAVHLLNETLDYLADTTRRLRALLEAQVHYFQQVTPWIDVKVRELRAEQVHNVTYNVGRVLEHVRAWQRQTLPHVQPDFYKVERLAVELEDLRRQVTGTSASPAPIVSPDYGRPLRPWDFPLAKDFRYYVFEEIFRGPSPGLKEKLRMYLPYFAEAPEPILDVGCGRGEFLEWMQSLGKDAYGLEVNAYEVQRLRAAGLRVVSEDALSHLRGLPAGSVGGVFCAQVVEHLLPEHVYELVVQLHRVMKSGAPLVIETLNPLSVYAFHRVYLIDPTHVYPVHPQTLVFFMRYAGFRDVTAHSITPVPDSVRLPLPGDGLPEEVRSYWTEVVRRLNEFLFDTVEYYVVGYRP